MQDATAEKVERHLDRARALGDVFAYVHIATHGNEKGIELGGQLLTWDWLSGVLDGVLVGVVVMCAVTVGKPDGSPVGVGRTVKLPTGKGRPRLPASVRGMVDTKQAQGAPRCPFCVDGGGYEPE